MTNKQKHERTCSLDAGLVTVLLPVDRLEVAPEAPADTDDFPLGKACDLGGEGTCESCQ